MTAILRTTLLIGLLAALAPACDAHANDAAGTGDDTGMLGPITGQQVYEQICAGCHMAGGEGAVGAGRYPAFAGNPAMASAPYMALTILQGRRNMPGFARPEQTEGFFVPTWLTEQQVADVINYIRGHFGNDYRDAISVDDVRTFLPPTTAKK